MILYINTTQNNLIEIGLKDKNKLAAVKKIKSHRTQAEKLLPAIEKLFKDNKLKLSNLESIEVENGGDSFTSLRIGVVTANALGYALAVPVTGQDKKAKQVKRVGNSKFYIVKPKYDREPSITKKINKR